MRAWRGGETGGVQAGAEERVGRGAVSEMWNGAEGYVRASEMMQKCEIAVGGAGQSKSGLGVVDVE